MAHGVPSEIMTSTIAEAHRLSNLAHYSNKLRLTKFLVLTETSTVCLITRDSKQVE